MFGRLNHVAIAVPDLDAAIARYRALGAAVFCVEIEGAGGAEQGARHIVLVRVVVGEFELGRKTQDALFRLIGRVSGN